MFIETSSPRQDGDVANLDSPKLQFSGNMCLKFYYHMYGADIDRLYVFINGDIVFDRCGEKGNKWLLAAIDVSLSGKFVVRMIIVPSVTCLVNCSFVTTLCCFYMVLAGLQYKTFCPLCFDNKTLIQSQ